MILLREAALRVIIKTNMEHIFKDFPLFIKYDFHSPIFTFLYSMLKQVIIVGNRELVFTD